MADVAIDALREYAGVVLKEYLRANREPIVYITEIEIVGSYVDGDFVEGESDIDIIIKTSDSVTEQTKEYFWQHFNSSHLQEEMQECVDVDVTRIDCVGIEET